MMTKELQVAKNGTIIFNSTCSNLNITFSDLLYLKTIRIFKEVSIDNKNKKKYRKELKI